MCCVVGQIKKHSVFKYKKVSLKSYCTALVVVIVKCGVYTCHCS